MRGKEGRRKGGKEGGEREESEREGGREREEGNRMNMQYEREGNKIVYSARANPRRPQHGKWWVITNMSLPPGKSMKEV